jgi:hypothetical protein
MALSLSLINGWMPAVAVIAVAVVFAVQVVRRRRRRRAGAQSEPPAESLAVAHPDRLTGLSSYRKALLRYRALLTGAVSLAVIAFVASVTLASRPAEPAAAQPQLANRDIVLCLDISGSMVDYDAPIVDDFSMLAKKFTGERLSLVLFNASAVTWFPLSSDYPYVSSQLDRLHSAMVAKDTSIGNGTLLGDGSSLIGDGLASCALRFDTPDANRSRSIILATDNVLAGKSIYTLPQAGELASSHGIRVYGINPGDTKAEAYLGTQAAEFRSVVAATGGSYYALDDPAAIPSIVARITAQQAAVLPGTPSVQRDDVPQLPFLALFLAITGYLVLMWRLRR